jgi:hypothetical protein
MNKKAFGRKRYGIIDVAPQHLPVVSEEYHENLRAFGGPAERNSSVGIAMGY